DIEELRKLIDARLSKDGADGRDSGITPQLVPWLLGSTLVGGMITGDEPAHVLPVHALVAAHPHGSELKKLEGDPVASDPHLLEQNGPPRRYLYGHRRQKHEWSANH